MLRFRFAALLALSVCVSETSAVEPYNPPIAAASKEAEQSMSGFKKPDSMTVSLFAAEPMLANPVAFCLDERGRVYVAETFRQQKGVEDNRSHMNWLHDDLALQTVEQRGDMFRKYLGDKVNNYGKEHDRIRLLVDTDGDGKADQSTVFADGFNDILDGTGAGLLARKGDVFYTCIPKLWKLRDTNNDGVADERKALHHGYGVRVAFRGHDMHGLVMGPDGRVYFSIGDRGYNVKTDDGRHFARPETGAVFRCNLDGSQLEVFAYGLRNPQELAFDDYGNLFTGDNNSDSGDRARWTYIPEAADIGWRMYFQYLPDRGPWNREKIWHPAHAGQPAYIVPCILNLADGPSGLVAYPGVGLPERYRGHFFLADFRGGPGNSGIRSFGMNPKGASFEVTDQHEFLWKILATDVDFGLDGSVYVSDWVNGWDGLGKGRIYRFTDAAAKDPAVQQAVELMKTGFTQRSKEELAKLLAHPDRRIRMEAQFELADRKDAESLTAVAKQHENQLARIHALWGLGQIARVKPEVLAAVTNLSMDADAEVRAQFTRVCGEAAFKGAATQLISLLRDDNLRVRSLAAFAVGKASHQEAIPALLKTLDDNANQDAVVRHAAAVALFRCASAQELAALKNLSPAARMGVVLALRRHRAPVIETFLKDSEPTIVLEAARAIHDEPIETALPALANLATQPLAAQNEQDLDALARRVVNANFRTGGRVEAERLARLAASKSLPEKVRLEVLEELKQWDNPSPLDRVIGDWRPLAKRDATFMPDVLRPGLGGLLSGSDGVRKAAADLAAKYGIKDVEPVLTQIARDAQGSVTARVAALSALATLKSPQLRQLADAMLSDQQAAVRVEARRIAVLLNPKNAVELLTLALESGEPIEQQGAVAELAKLKTGDADDVLAAWLERLTKGDVRPTIQLDLLDAARLRNTSTLKQRVAAYEQTFKADDPLSKYRVAMEGGSAERGREIFFTRGSVSCLRCHSVAGSGGAVGPELTKIEAEKNREYLLEAIVAPNAKIAKGFETVIAITDSGRSFAGIVKEDTAEALKLLTAEGTLVTLKKSEIEETAKGQSAMPADLIKHLTLSELRDLVEYLASPKSAAGHGH